MAALGAAVTHGGRRARRSAPSERAWRDRIRHIDDFAELIRTGNGLVDADPRLAAHAYRRASELPGDTGVALNNLGVACWNLGNRGEALALFRRAAGLSPADRNVAENLAGALLDLGRPEEARRWFRQAATLAPGKSTLLAPVDPHGY